MKQFESLTEDELFKISGGGTISENNKIATAVAKILKLPDGKFTWYLQDDPVLEDKLKDCTVVGTSLSALGYTFQYDEKGNLKKIISPDGKSQEFSTN